MTIMEAIDARHSVRAYKDLPISQEVRDQLDAFVSGKTIRALGATERD